MTNFQNADLNKLIDSKELIVLDDEKDWFFRLQDLNGDIYYFIKPYFEENQDYHWLRGILGEKICEFYEKYSVHYYKANYYGRNLFGKKINVSGLLSKSFLKTGSIYITGKELLEEYRKSLTKEEILKYYGNYDFDNADTLNNLDVLWHALEYRYRNHPDKNNIVSNLMSEITDLYEFTLLTGDSDRHFNNYQIEEIENGVHLTPYYDFDNIYSLSNYNRLSVEPSNLYLSFEKSLEVYFRFVTKEKRESFRNKLESLTKELIERFLDDIIKNNSKNEEEKTNSWK